MPSTCCPTWVNQCSCSMQPLVLLHMPLMASSDLPACRQLQLPWLLQQHLAAQVWTHVCLQYRLACWLLLAWGVAGMPAWRQGVVQVCWALHYHTSQVYQALGLFLQQG